MKLRRSTVLPLCLAAYLAVMAYIGYDGYDGGETSAAMYFGTIAVTIVIIVLLHFNLKRREQLRRERENDLKKNDK
ncbi:MAG: hypothetical protein J6C67_05595 [Muribaculaceae bacterium]|nr:hypothetical protein [Muribaculaceae bacterium]